MTRFSFVLIFAATGLCLASCASSVRNDIDYCADQARKTLAIIPSEGKFPNSVDPGTSEWKFTNINGWTCGFWPGQLWYLYEGTGDEFWKEEAVKATEQIMPVAYTTADSHDVGFVTMPSIGHAYDHTSDPRYLQALESAADSLMTLFNPVVGTTLSWPSMVEKMNWPHNTIIDNMLNLELLFRVAEICDRPDLYSAAFRHAEVTMHNQFREDHSTFHVAVFDPSDGSLISRHTHQGWKDESMWARGQAWAVYGFTMAYRFTRHEPFLKTAVDAAETYMDRLPEDLVPFWDFDAGEQLENQPKDCSAAAIVASAFFELQGYVDDELSKTYMDFALRTIDVLSNPPYRAGDRCSAFLLHATGHVPNNYEIDASISYADYYYLEALTRMKKLGL